MSYIIVDGNVFIFQIVHFVQIIKNHQYLNLSQTKAWIAQYNVPLNPVECHHLVQTSDLVGLILVQSLLLLAYYALYSVV